MRKNTIVWVLLVLLVLLFLLDLGVEAAVYDGSILLPVHDLFYPLSQVSQNTQSLSSFDRKELNTSMQGNYYFTNF